MSRNAIQEQELSCPAQKHRSDARLKTIKRLIKTMPKHTPQRQPPPNYRVIESMRQCLVCMTQPHRVQLTQLQIRKPTHLLTQPATHSISRVTDRAGAWIAPWRAIFMCIGWSILAHSLSLGRQAQLSASDAHRHCTQILLTP